MQNTVYYLNHYSCKVCPTEWANIGVVGELDNCPKCGAPNIAPYYLEQHEEARKREQEPPVENKE